MSFEEEDTCPSCSALDAAHAVPMLPAAAHAACGWLLTITSLFVPSKIRERRGS
jgi:hypothetical protein